MGDTIDVAVKQDSLTFVPVSASAISFQVRGFNPVQLTFVTSTNIWDDSYIAFEITLGTQSSIDHVDGIDKCYAMPSLDSLATDWTGFWTTWDQGCVRVGRDSEEKPFMERCFKGIVDLENIKFVSPSTEQAQWKFDVGPKRPEPRSYPVTGGDPVWMPVGDSLPTGAVIGGHENEPLHVIRAAHRGSLTPGKFVPSHGTAYIPWGGEAHDKEDFEVLVGYNLEWVETSGNNIPLDAMPAGISEINKETLYIGRAEIDGHLIPGKVQPSHKVVYVPYKGKEIAKKNYEILVTSANRDSHLIIQRD